MPDDGSGTYTRSNGTNSGSGAWAADALAGTKITTTRHDLHDQDVADALTARICKNGATTPTADLPMGTYKHTGVGNATARTNYLSCAQAQDGAVVWGGTSAGTANAQTVTLTPAVTAYATGSRILFIAGNTNTGATTLNVNSVGATAIRKSSSQSALAAGDIISGQLVEVVYDGTYWRLCPREFQWQDWTPTYGGTGSMTYGTVTTNVARYMLIGKLLVIRLDCAGTTGGVADTRITISSPVALTASTLYGALAVPIFDSSRATGHLEVITSGGWAVRREDAANWGTGAARGVQGVFIAEAA